MQKLEGVLVPMVTCFDRNGKLHEKATREFTSFLIGKGVHGLLPTASNGEHPHLSDEELLEVWKIVVDETNNRVPVAPCTTSDSTAHTIELSKRAERAGASAVLIGPPPYFGINLTEEELFGHYSDIAEAISIPIVIYNEPLIHGADLRPELVARLAEINNISYIKESTYNAMRIHQVISAAGKRITVFIGACNIALEAFVLGAKGWITGAHNFIPKQAVELYEACVKEKNFEKGKSIYYDTILPVCRLISSTPKGYQAVREAVSMIGLDAGPPRKPLTPIDEGQRKELRNLLRKLGVLLEN